MITIRCAWSADRFLMTASVLAVVAAAVISQSPLPFSPLQMPVPWDVLGTPFGFGDVNGDGAPDLVVSGAPYVVLNDGHGRFTPAVGSSGFAGSTAGIVPTPPPFVIADFNQDGRDDLFTVSTSGGLWFGTAAGTLTPAPAPPSVSAVGIGSVAAGDVDGDGAPEIVYGTLTVSGTLQPTHVLQNDGTGSFTDVGNLGLAQVGRSPMTFLDFDLDGDQDVAVCNNSGAVVMMVNNGGTFTWQGSYGGAVTSTNLVKARLNGDAYPDLVWWAIGPVPLLYVGGPSGMTPSSATLSSPVQGNASRQVAVFDVTGDGIDEVVIAFDSGISIWSVASPGPAVLVNKLDRPAWPIFAANLDGDSDVDLLAKSNSVYCALFSDWTGVLHPQGPSFEPKQLRGSPAPIDLSGDGAPELVGLVVDASQAVKLAIAQNDGTGGFTWTTAPIAGAPLANVASHVSAADVDGDGQKDLAVLELTFSINFGWSIALRAIMNGGGGLWTAGPATTLASSPRCDVAVADLNGDGRDDLVFSAYYQGVRVLYSSGSGFVTPGTTISGDLFANRLALFDADGDLDLDVALAGEPSKLLLNAGSGASFTQDLSFPALNATFVTAADVDGALGTADVLLDNKVYLHQGASWVGAGMIPPSPHPGAAPVEVRVFDFDFDGDDDAVTGAGIAHVFEAPGVVSTYALPMTGNPAAYFGWRFQPVDLDRDGDLDLLGGRPIEDQSVYAPMRPQVVLFNTSRQLSQNSPARPGRPLDVELHGAPGGQWFLYASAATASIAAPPFGTIFLDQAGAILLGAGGISATGSGVTSIIVPGTASTYVGTTFEFQGFVDTLAGPRLTNARHVTLVGF